MNKNNRVAFRVDDNEKEMMEAIANKFGRSESASMRLMIRQFAAALGLSESDGRPMIRVKTETVDELPY